MSRAGFSFRGALSAALFAGCMVFGVSQAVAGPQPGTPIPVSCDPYDRFSSELCSDECSARGYERGYCARPGACRCLS
jgi:hypothetical protein